MFGRLIKHELRATSRMIPFIFGVISLIALFHVFAGRFLGNMAAGLSLALLILSLVAQVILVWVMIAIRYYKSMYADEGYLTNTLPIKTSSIFRAKFLVSYFWIVISSLFTFIIAGGLILNYASLSGVETQGVLQFLDTLIGFLGIPVSGASLVGILLFVLLISSLCNLITIFFSVTLGSTSVFRKMGMGGPVLMYIIVYSVMQVLTLAASFLIPFSLEMTLPTAWNIGESIQWNFVWGRGLLNMIQEPSIEGLIPLGSYLLYPFIYIPMFVISLKVVSKKKSTKLV